MSKQLPQYESEIAVVEPKWRQPEVPARTHGTKREMRLVGVQKGAVYSQEIFAALLQRERRRSERSGNPFALMLITGQSSQSTETLIECLCRDMRETDIVGWHRAGVAGVILTESGEQEIAAAMHGAEVRVRELSARHLNEERGVRIEFHVFPEVVGRADAGSEFASELYPDIAMNEGHKQIRKFVKRIFDIVTSMALIIAFSPILILCFVLVRITSKGPVFFRQERVGQFGKPFKMLKFRSMYMASENSVHKAYVQQFISGKADASENGGMYKLVRDKRITPVGGILRRTSLDELPQLFNVLRGDMSLIGPRPALRYEVESYRYWHRRRYLETRPGITGLWQVSGRSKIKFDDMVRLDLRYAEKQSIWLDLMIIFRTPLAMVSGR